MSPAPERTQLSALPTPALVVDGESVRRNVQRMADYARTHEIALRPHTKTHKSLFFSGLQIAAGECCGLTVAKVGEAMALRPASESILIAYPTVDAPRTNHIAQLARETDVIVAVDSHLAVDRLSCSATHHESQVGVLVDLDVGFHRTGLQTIAESIALAQRIDSLSGIQLRGLFIYPGHVTGDQAARETAMRTVSELVTDTLSAWVEHGLCTEVVSGGTTPSAYESHLIRQLTEIRPGTYIFNDCNIWHGGYCQLDDCAARIICTVVSNAVPGKVILDGGSKTLTSDKCGPAPDAGHGYIVEYPEAHIGRLTEEHAEVDISRCTAPPKIGERVTVIPNHICPCVNLQDVVWWRDSANSEELIAVAVDGRGRLS